MTSNYGDFGLPCRSYMGSAALEDSLGQGIARVVLVAIRNDRFPPVFYGQDSLQRMRAVFMEPGKRAELHPPDFMLEPLPKALLSRPAISVSENFPASPRLVKGEILRDESGRLYEKIDSLIRPLHQLISGPRGEILEFGPPAPGDARLQKPMAERLISDSPPAQSPEKYAAGQNEKSNESARPLSPPKSERPSFRTLLPQNGLLRQARWGDFKLMLAPQPAHPECLRDEHWLPCYAQVYEVTTALRWEALGAILLGDEHQANQLQLLTDELARKLQLETLLHGRPRVPAHIRREPGVALPHDLIFRLQLAHDPTRHHVVQNHAQSHAPSAASESFAPATKSSNGVAAPSSISENVAPPITALGSEAEKNPACLKNAIPQQFALPHEFLFTREEALYDLRLEAMPKGALLSLLRWMKKNFAGRAGLRKWQVLLNGKNFDAQLWTVRPPKGMLSHPAIREWARQTLALAGYDLQTMPLEWEIFWRRKGV